MKIVTKENVKSAIAQGSHVLIDVRTDDEVLHGMIPGAIHVPLPKLESELRLRSELKTRKVIFYCKSGGRALKATELADRLGFDASCYKGSMNEWVNDNE